MRNTRQRNLVLEIVNNSFNHPTAYFIHQECIKVLPNISLGTVYRNLNTLVEMGSIQRLVVPEHVDRYDKVKPHDHFVCMRCGNVIDLERSNITYEEIINGNLIMNCKIQYEGICNDCLKLEKEGDGKDGIKGK